MLDLSPVIKTEIKNNKGKKRMITLLFLSSEHLLNKYPTTMKEKPYINEPTIGSSLKKLTILFL